MKKLVLGAVAMAITMSVASAHAVSTKSPREMLIEYNRTSREAVFGKGGSAKNLKDSALDQVKDTLLKQLELPDLTGRLRPNLSGTLGRERMDNLVTIIAAKKLSVELAKVDGKEAQSIEAAANASAKLLANTDTFGVKKSTDLTDVEAKDVSAALTKAESLPDRILTEFSKSERESYTQVIERFDSLNKSGSKKSAEDNFVQAIMDVKKVDRKTALEIAKKLKECV
jgi:hypothetical protein